MSLDRLLSQFDALAEHGTNIARIRKLLIINVIKRSISRDGFLQRAAAAKAQIALASKNPGGKVSKTRNQDLALPDVLLKIPTEAFGRLGDIAEIEKGLTAIQKSKPGPYPLVVTAETRSSNETFDFEGPAVVIPMVSSTGHGHASLKRIHYQEGKFAAGNILSVVKPKLPELLNTRFLYEYLTAFKEELLVARMVGTANVSLTINALRDIPVPLIQGEDVAKVDELMALCDRLEAQLKERDVKQAALAKAAMAKFTEDPTPENLQLLFHPSFSIEPEDLRKSILALAVQGKLVAQNPNDEPADQLLAKLMKRDAKDTGRRKKSQPVLAFTHDEIPYELPHGWAWERLGNIGETNIGLTYSPQDVSDVGIPVLRSSNVQNGKLDFNDLVRVKCEPKQSTMVQDGDLLICARNGSKALVGKVAIIEGLNEPAAFGAFMAIYRSVVNQYLYYFIRSPLFRQMIDEVNTTTINQITQNNLRSTLAPIPPLAEQRRIVEKVKQLLTLIDSLETQLEASRTTSEKLLEAMVAELTNA
jgi:type I restriction enzyme, S subunit